MIQDTKYDVHEEMIYTKREPNLFPFPLDCMDIDDTAESDNSFHLHSRADSTAAETGPAAARQAASTSSRPRERELQQDSIQSRFDYI